MTVLKFGDLGIGPTAPGFVELDFLAMAALVMLGTSRRMRAPFRHCRSYVRPCVSASSGPPSNASILATPIPEPSTWMLAILGLCMALAGRRAYNR